VLGNVYAHVETITGYGFRHSPCEPWSVFDAIDMVEQRSAGLRQVARAISANSAS
jgi:hypothetical protein